jgi:probable biosynthetic protein (TIGR04099 family)
MPQLAYAGLSENWLLKECGDLHWDCLAQGYGMIKPDFRDVSGKKAYAAFTAIRISKATLDRVCENDRIQIDCSVAPATRAQFFSRHVAHRPDGVIARVDMLSAFVFRRRGQDNRSVERALLRVNERWAGGNPEWQTEEGMRLAEQARARRAGIRLAGATAPDIAPLEGPAPQTFVFSPCPNNDFNGANFMYFATFAALADRAEWHFFKPESLLTLISREIFFYGNVNVGEDVAVRLMSSQRPDGDGLSHRCVIVRLADGCAIAEVFTLKRLSRSADYD